MSALSIALPFPSQPAIPWPEVVVVTSVNSNPSLNVSATVTDAGVYQLGNKEGSPSDGVYTKFAIEVTIGQADVPFTPKPADTVLWNGNTYTVQDVQSFNWLQFHKLRALNLILAFQLSQIGVLSRPTNAQDATGKLTFASSVTIAAAVPCRLQPIGGDATDIGKTRTLPLRFTAILGQQLVPRAKDVFTVSGIDYTILDFKSPERIDELMTLSLELIGTPSGYPILVTPPSISGSVLQGGTLTVVPGTYTNSPTLTYQWFSAGVAVATGTSYVTQASDDGDLISVVETATLGTVSRQTTSPTVGPITAGGTGLTGTFNSGNNPP